MLFSQVLLAKPLLELATHNLNYYGSFTKGHNKAIADDSFTDIAVDTVRCAMSQLAQPIKIHVVPWARAQNMAKNDKVAGFFAASQNSERDQYATFSHVIADQDWAWFYLSDATLKPSSKQFKEDAFVASFIGANMLNWLKSENFNVVLEAKDSETLFDALLEGRINAILANRLVGEAIMKKLALSEQISVTVESKRPLGVYFTHHFLSQRPTFLEKFNAAVSRCYNR